MRKQIKIIIGLLFLFWTVNAHASPIGERPEIWLDFQYRETEQDSPLFDAPEKDPVEFWNLGLLRDMPLSENQNRQVLALHSQEETSKIPVYSFIFSYGSYLHRWKIPQFQAPVQTPFFEERPFEYKGPAPEPEPPPQIPLEDVEKYRYPTELITPKHMYP